VEILVEKGMLTGGTAAVGTTISAGRPETFETQVAEVTSSEVFRRQEQRLDYNSRKNYSISSTDSSTRENWNIRGRRHQQGFSELEVGEHKGCIQQQGHQKKHVIVL
jgi:hypothetical protein